jgi:hypothetical protein
VKTYKQSNKGGVSEMGTFHCEKEKYVMKNINNEMQVSTALKKQFMNKIARVEF